MKAWLFQNSRQVKELGDDAPWLVGWYDPDGKKRSKTLGPKSKAQKYLRKIEGQLASGNYEENRNVTWKKFRAEYEANVTDSMKPRTRQATLDSLGHFERIIKPRKVSTINARTVDKFIAARRQEPGKKNGSKLSAASINKDLRHLKAIFNRAHEWGYLAKVPKIKMEKEPSRLPTYVSPEDFEAIYNACDAATMPRPHDALPYPPGDWWRALLIFSYMTGWRISEILALRKEDIDWNSGHAITRHEDNKGGREERVKLHPVVLDHLKTIASFEPVVFPWPHDRRTLDTEFHRIQTAAGIKVPCRQRHEHTDACHRYGFHDLRRAFATMNAGSLSADVLQKLMRHQSYSTTQRYVAMANRVDEAVEQLAVPNVKRSVGGVS